MSVTTLDWKTVYATLHRDGEAAFPPAALHYILQLIRQLVRKRAGAGSTPLTPEAIITNFRVSVRSDFGPLTREVLEEWNLRTPDQLGRAVLLLGRYQCLSLEPSDTPEAFAADTTPFTEGEPT